LTKPTIVWNPANNASKYQVQLIENLSTIALDTTISSTSVILTKFLKGNTSYNWKVRGINESLNRIGDWSAEWKFTTLSIPKPLLTAPSNGTQGVTGGNELKWSTTNNTNNYLIQLSPVNNFSSIYLNLTTQESNFYLPGFQTGDPITFYWRVRSNTIYGVSDWSDVWSFSRAKLTSNDQTDGLPIQFALHQNYPNPFNPTTQIPYQIPTAGEVSLQLYAMDGRWIQTLKSGYLSAGFYTYTLDASKLSSGRYFVVLQQGNERRSIQISLVK